MFSPARLNREESMVMLWFSVLYTINIVSFCKKRWDLFHHDERRLSLMSRSIWSRFPFIKLCVPPPPSSPSSCRCCFSTSTIRSTCIYHCFPWYLAWVWYATVFFGFRLRLHLRHACTLGHSGRIRLHGPGVLLDPARDIFGCSKNIGDQCSSSRAFEIASYGFIVENVSSGVHAMFCLCLVRRRIA